MEGKILDRVVAAPGMGRSTPPGGCSAAHGYRSRPSRSISANLRLRGLLRPRQGAAGCGKYLVVMCEAWLPLLAAAGDLDKPFATESR